MKLYYAVGACSVAPHIVLYEAGFPFEVVKVDLRTHKFNGDQDFYTVNSKGSVPVLELSNGERLTENVAILQYLADQAPGKQLMPEVGSFQRYRTVEWLSFIATELHKSFGPLFNASMPAEAKQFATDKLARNFKWIDEQLADKQFLLGDTFNVADAYLFAVARWCAGDQLSLEHWKNLNEYIARIRARPAVQEVIKAEGL